MRGDKSFIPIGTDTMRPEDNSTFRNAADLARSAVEDRRTIPALFLYVTGRYDNPAAFVERVESGFEPISTAEFRNMVIDIALGLQAIDVNEGDRVAILSENRVEWAASDFAITCSAAVTVPISPLCSSEQLAFIIENSGARFAIVSTYRLLEKLRDCIPETMRDFTIVCMEGPPDTTADISIEEVAERGANRFPDREDRFTEIALSVTGTDLSTIMYTSGTTGVPKGVRLTHRNVVSNVLDIARALRVSPDDRCLSFLPLSHAFERTAGFLTIFYHGATIAYAESVSTVSRDLREVEPTIVVSVPRLYEKMEQGIRDDMSKMIRPLRSICSRALDLAHRCGRAKGEQRKLKGTMALCHRLADFLVYRKIRRNTGGKGRLFISGGAPLAADLAELLHGCGMPVLEGYGLTEASPVCTVNRPEHFTFGSVGLPLPGVRIKIAPDGEVLVSGENVMEGYQKLDEETGRCLVGGWLHTGDLGHIDEDGFLFLTGRKKEMIITSWGVNVSPLALEGHLKRSPYIQDIMVLGDGRPYIGALIVPAFDRLRDHPELDVESESDPETLCQNPQVCGLIENELERCLSDFSPKERIRKFVLIPRTFSIEKGELTSTMKLVRPVIERHFTREIGKIYEKTTGRTA